MARQVMRRCAKVFARDHLSRAYLDELGVGGVADEATDVSGLFETIIERIPAPSEPVDAGSAQGSGRVKVIWPAPVSPSVNELTQTR